MALSFIYRKSNNRIHQRASALFQFLNGITTFNRHLMEQNRDFPFPDKICPFLCVNKGNCRSGLLRICLPEGFCIGNTAAWKIFACITLETGRKSNDLFLRKYGVYFVINGLQLSV